MSEVTSFGNIVTTLLDVRQNYHEQLKSIPQYEAFLLVESSTEKAAGALQGGADPASSIAAEVIDSLQFARSRFEQHLNSVPEYRALLAIDKLIKEISVDLGLQGDAEPAAGADETESPAAPAPAVAATEQPEPVAHDAEESEPAVAEATALPSVEMPIQSASRVTPATAVHLDDEPIDDDDIVSVHVPSLSEETDENEDLLQIARGLTELSSEPTPAPVAAEPYSVVSQQPKIVDRDDDEAAA